MTTTADRKQRVDHTTKVPRWALWVAHAVPICVLPSGLWCLAMSIGIPVGYSEAVLREDYDLPGWGAVYTIGLAVALECLGLLTLGLVYPWGVFPRWIPFIGGKSVPRMAAVIPAGIGAALITMITFSQLSMRDKVDSASVPLMGLSYAPVLAWGPLLAVVTVAYFIRRGKATPLLS